MKRRGKALAGGLLAAVYFHTHVTGAHGEETRFWEQRRAAVRRAERTARPYPLLARLPAPAGLPTTFSSGAADAIGQADGAEGLPGWLGALVLPHGAVREFHLAKDPDAPLVIHIQDAHGVEEAQRRTAALIRGLMEERGVGLVGLEGAAGAFVFDPFRAFPHQDIRLAVDDYFLREGHIGGPEYAALTAPRPPLLWGVEDLAAYRRNIEAFKDSIKSRPLTRGALSTLRAVLEELKGTAYSEPLKEFDRRASAYRDGREPLGAYAAYLADAAPAARGRNVGVLLDALALEKNLDFPKVEADRLRLAEALAGKLSAARVDALARQSLEHQAGRMGHGDYYRFLRGLCQEAGIDTDGFGWIKKYIDYVLLAEKINRAGLLDEFDRLEKAVPEALARTAGEKELVKADRDLRLLERLASHAMTPSDWDRYQKNRGDILDAPRRLEAAALRLGRPAPPGPPADLAVALQPFEEFCRLAIARNQALIDNLLAKMRTEKARSAVLVAGGFHTDGLTALLRDRGASYAVVTPRMERVPDGNRALDALARDPLPIEKLFQGEVIGLVQPIRHAACHFADPAVRAYLGLRALLHAAAARRLRRPVPAGENPGPLVRRLSGTTVPGTGTVRWVLVWADGAVSRFRTTADRVRSALLEVSLKIGAQDILLRIAPDDPSPQRDSTGGFFAAKPQRLSRANASAERPWAAFPLWGRLIIDLASLGVRAGRYFFPDMDPASAAVLGLISLGISIYNDTRSAAVRAGGPLRMHSGEGDAPGFRSKAMVTAAWMERGGVVLRREQGEGRTYAIPSEDLMADGDDRESTVTLLKIIDTRRVVAAVRPPTGKGAGDVTFLIVSYPNPIFSEDRLLEEGPENPFIPWRAVLEAAGRTKLLTLKALETGRSLEKVQKDLFICFWQLGIIAMATDPFTKKTTYRVSDPFLAQDPGVTAADLSAAATEAAKLWLGMDEPGGLKRSRLLDFHRQARQTVGELARQVAAALREPDQAAATAETALLSAQQARDRIAGLERAAGLPERGMVEHRLAEGFATFLEESLDRRAQGRPERRDDLLERVNALRALAWAVPSAVRQINQPRGTRTPKAAMNSLSFPLALGFLLSQEPGVPVLIAAISAWMIFFLPLLWRKLPTRKTAALLLLAATLGCVGLPPPSGPIPQNVRRYPVLDHPDLTAVPWRPFNGATETTLVFDPAAEKLVLVVTGEKGLAELFIGMWIGERGWPRQSNPYKEWFPGIRQPAADVANQLAREGLLAKLGQGSLNEEDLARVLEILGKKGRFNVEAELDPKGRQIRFFITADAGAMRELIPPRFQTPEDGRQAVLSSIPLPGGEPPAEEAARPPEVEEDPQPEPRRQPPVLDEKFPRKGEKEAAKEKEKERKWPTGRESWEAIWDIFDLLFPILVAAAALHAFSIPGEAFQTAAALPLLLARPERSGAKRARINSALRGLTPVAAGFDMRDLARRIAARGRGQLATAAEEGRIVVLQAPGDPLSEDPAWLDQLERIARLGNDAAPGRVVWALTDNPSGPAVEMFWERMRRHPALRGTDLDALASRSLRPLSAHALTRDGEIWLKGLLNAAGVRNPGKIAALAMKGGPGWDLTGLRPGGVEIIGGGLLRQTGERIRRITLFLRNA